MVFGCIAECHPAALRNSGGETPSEPAGEDACATNRRRPLPLSSLTLIAPGGNDRQKNRRENDDRNHEQRNKNRDIALKEVGIFRFAWVYQHFDSDKNKD